MDSKKVARWLSQFQKEAKDLEEELNIRTEDDFIEWYAEAITLGSKKFMDLVKKKAQVSVLDKLIQEDK